MKTYTITVNGNAYAVTVEEGTSVAPVAMAPVAVAPVAPVAAAPAPVAAPAPAATAGTAGAVKINAPMPGKILKVAVSAGQAVKKGNVLVILEAMKMENEIVAPQDATVASVNVSAGDSVEAGVLLASLN